MKFQIDFPDERTAYVDYEDNGTYIYAKYPNGIEAPINPAEYATIGTALALAGAAEAHGIDIKQDLEGFIKLVEIGSAWTFKDVQDLQRGYTLKEILEGDQHDIQP